MNPLNSLSHKSFELIPKFNFVVDVTGFLTSMLSTMTLEQSVVLNNPEYQKQVAVNIETVSRLLAETSIIVLLVKSVELPEVQVEDEEITAIEVE